MNIARPSQADIDAMLDLYHALDTASDGFDPSLEDEPFFDTENPHACRRVLAHILDKIPRNGGMLRFVYGMATLCAPRNAIIDPDSDVLALHPRLLQKENA